MFNKLTSVSEGTENYIANELSHTPMNVISNSLVIFSFYSVHAQSSFILCQWFDSWQVTLNENTTIFKA